MATEYQTKKVTELEAKTTAEDTDLLAVGGGGGAILKKMTLSTLANWIKTKVSGFTYSLNVGTKTLIQAINALSQGTGSVQYTFSGGGYLTTSNTVISVTVPTNRVINGVSIKSITLDGCQIRQNGSYLINGTEDISVTASTGGYCGITLSIRKMQNDSPVSLGGTNNDSVGVWVRFTVVYE